MYIKCFSEKQLVLPKKEQINREGMLLKNSSDECVLIVSAQLKIWECSIG
jgi:hypothetical protein